MDMINTRKIEHIKIGKFLDLCSLFLAKKGFNTLESKWNA
jgi:hypothetical protein